MSHSSVRHHVVCSCISCCFVKMRHSLRVTSSEASNKPLPLRRMRAWSLSLFEILFLTSLQRKTNSGSAIFSTLYFMYIDATAVMISPSTSMIHAMCWFPRNACREGGNVGVAPVLGAMVFGILDIDFPLKSASVLFNLS